MFYLVNASNSIHPHHVGTVISAHDTTSAAQAAQAAYAKTVQRHCGPDTTIPTTVVEAAQQGLRAHDCYRSPTGEFYVK